MSGAIGPGAGVRPARLIDRLPKASSFDAKNHAEASGVVTVAATFAGARFLVTAFTATFFDTTVAAASLPSAFFGAAFLVAASGRCLLGACSLLPSSPRACPWRLAFQKRAADFAASVAFATSRFAASMAFFVSARSFSRRFFAAWASRASTLAFLVGAASFFATGFFW
ncbi:hypothetical protein ACTMU2_22205 [Cupriavidus basilensis]